MPPKYKFTREQIIAAALTLTKEHGISGLTARGVAAKLGSSAKPIFGLFHNMEELQSEVINSANMLYQSYIQRGIADKKYPPYKASGMAYIQFAKEEKELFKILFMRDRTKENIEENRDQIRPLLKMIMKNLAISEDQAFLFHDAPPESFGCFLLVWLYYSISGRIYIGRFAKEAPPHPAFLSCQNPRSMVQYPTEA